ncbi:hypothetical protein F-VV57_0019 [Faustovirus]|nr:hypothetical protein F-VV57_0019 [Faustovirus]QJX73286.1 hypothetical protein F-VV63_0020 [Faustovirus]
MSAVLPYDIICEIAGRKWRIWKALYFANRQIYARLSALVRNDRNYLRTHFSKRILTESLVETLRHDYYMCWHAHTSRDDAYTTGLDDTHICVYKGKLCKTIKYKYYGTDMYYLTEISREFTVVDAKSGCVYKYIEMVEISFGKIGNIRHCLMRDGNVVMSESYDIKHHIHEFKVYKSPSKCNSMFKTVQYLQYPKWEIKYPKFIFNVMAYDKAKSYGE